MDDATIAKNIAENLQAVIDNRGMSRGDVARLNPGEPRQSVYRLFRAESVANIAIVARIAKSLSVSIDSLVAPSKKKS